MSTLTFDTHYYIKNLQAKGFSEARAEAVIDALSVARSNDDSHNVTKGEFNEFKSEMRNDFVQVESKLEQKISQVKIDLIKWMYAGFFSIGLMIIGLFIKLT